jgi:hypothetical protein
LNPTSFESKKFFLILGHELQSQQRKRVFDGTQDPRRFVNLVFDIELLELMLGSNLHEVGPLVSNRNGDRGLLFAHFKLEIGNVDKSISLQVGGQVESVKRNLHTVQFTQSVGSRIGAACRHETNFVSSSSHILKKFFDLQIGSAPLIVKENRVVNIKNDGFVFCDTEFVHLSTNRKHCLAKFILAFQHAHLFMQDIFELVFEQMPTRQFVDELYPKFGVKAYHDRNIYGQNVKL